MIITALCNIFLFALGLKEHTIYLC